MQEEVGLIPDRQSYAVGDTAELLIQAPFYPAEALVSWRRSGIVKVERVSLTGPTTTIQVPLTEAMVPNLWVQVDLVGSAPRVDDAGQPAPSLPRRPAYATGSINLPIPPRTRTLDVSIAPNAAKLGPGERASLDVLVRDAGGRPVAGSEVAVLAVDEAVLALTGYQFPNPIDSFYGGRDSGTSDYHSRAYVRLARPEAANLAGGGARGRGGVDATAALEDKMMPPPSPSAAPPMEAADDMDMAVAERAVMKAPGRAQGATAGGAAAAPIAVRSNFDPLAVFAPEVKTGADGRARVDLTLPDNLTRYRLVAIAVAGDKQFGKGESAITARLPLMVRPSPPRFLNFGDAFELPIVVQNQTDAALTVQLAARTTNLALTAGRGRQVVVPANDRVEVRLPAAAEMAGTARLQVVAVAGTASDAAELALPVWTPATTEAFATYGVVDGGAASGAIRQPIALPTAVVKQFGGLDVTTSSTQLQALTDAVLYLVRYPYECAEQRASRILAIAALRDVLTAFDVPEMPTPAELERSVADDLERLKNLQNGDGGFPFWQRGFESWPYLTVHVTNALVRAKAKGYAVPTAMLDRALAYLGSIEQRYPSDYGPEIRRSISSYALYVRKLAGDVDVAKAKRLLADAGGASKLSLEADGWLLGTLAGRSDAAAERAAIAAHLGNRVAETAGAANFTDGYTDGSYLLLASDRRADAVILESMIEEAPGSDLLPKLVTGLLAHKKAGRWQSTSENAFVLLALDRYFEVFEKATPNFVARAWIGSAYAGDHAFRGRSTDSYQLDIPMSFVADNLGKGTAAGPGKGDLVLQKDGAGRMYYRIGMTYAPADLRLPAADYGFVVERRYEAVDDPADVVRAADGTWQIKAGARVRVRLAMVAENRRYHVALVDPLPAGLEAMNPALAVTGPIPRDPKAQADRGAYWWWSSTWYEHQNLRDERVEAFTSLLWEGVHEYTYVARATTPGTFVVPPAKAEEMYMPETFGRSATDRVVVR
ncbi:MAG: alpha-2-macroglobulin family protein [Kofleriaceae bacterium]